MTRAASLIALLLLLASAACSKGPENVIIVSVDALNRSALAAYGESAPSLPAIDGFTGGAAVFSRAFASASWTLPSHASMLTGLYPDRHGAMHWKQSMSDQVPTLAGRLREAGFETAAFTDGAFVSRAFGLARGFDRYDEWSDPEAAWRQEDLPRGGEADSIPGRNLFDRAIAYLRGRQGRGTPFFLFLHTYSVHHYFNVRPWATEILPPYRDRSSSEYLDCLTGKLSCTQADWDRLEALYRAETPNMDRGFGRLLETLEELGIGGSTVVFFLSDHGEGFDPRLQRIHHGGRLHEDQIRVPLIVSGAGINAGDVDTPVSLVDLMPTVLDLFGVPVPPDLDGRSFAPALRGEAPGAPRDLFAQEHAYWWAGLARMEVPSAPARALSVAVIRDGEWYIKTMMGEEVYDMERDPLQTGARAAGSPSLVELRSLAAKMAKIRATHRTVPRDEDLKERLRSLGYIR